MCPGPEVFVDFLVFLLDLHESALDKSSPDLEVGLDIPF